MFNLVFAFPCLAQLNPYLRSTKCILHGKYWIMLRQSLHVAEEEKTCHNNISSSRTEKFEGLLLKTFIYICHRALNYIFYSNRKSILMRDGEKNEQLCLEILFSFSKLLSHPQKLLQLTQHTWLFTLQSIAALSPVLNSISEGNHMGKLEYLRVRMGSYLCLTDSVEISVASSTNSCMHQKHKSFLRSEDKPEILSSTPEYQPRRFSELMFRTGLLSR